MKKLATLIFFLWFSFGLTAQDTIPAPEAAEPEVQKPIDKPVREPFSSGYIIDAQTTLVQPKNTLEFYIQHKFGTIENGISDLYGIYAPAGNIRMGLNYVILDNVQVGWGIAKLNMYNDFSIKWNILQQTRKNTIPVALAVYGNVAIDSKDKIKFGSTYAFTDRLSYFAEVIVGRKFNGWLSLQMAGSFSHYNFVDTGLEHDRIGIHFNGRAKISPQGAIIFNYDIPLNIKAFAENYDFPNSPLPNLSFGAEVATSTHAFQIVMGTASGIIPQEMIMYNHNDYTKGQLALGFLITRLWNF